MNEFYTSLEWIEGAPKGDHERRAGLVLKVHREPGQIEYVLVGGINEECGTCGHCTDWDAYYDENITEHAYLFPPETL